jgi:hypothetical protein
MAAGRPCHPCTRSSCDAGRYVPSEEDDARESEPEHHLWCMMTTGRLVSGQRERRIHGCQEIKVSENLGSLEATMRCKIDRWTRPC